MAVTVGVVGFIDFPHSARAQPVVEAIVPDLSWCNENPRPETFTISKESLIKGSAPPALEFWESGAPRSGTGIITLCRAMTDTGGSAGSVCLKVRPACVAAA